MERFLVQCLQALRIGLCATALGSCLAILPGPSVAASGSAVSSETPVEVLHTFVGRKGAPHKPIGALRQSADGYIWGQTSAGGPDVSGTAFKFKPGGELKPIDFAAGHWTSPPIDGGDGWTYGTLRSWGEKCGGAIYKMDRSRQVQILYKFNADDGCIPGELTVGSDGDLYGVTGPHSDDFDGGSIFKITRDGRFTLLHVFADEETGARPSTLVLHPDGNLYGTTFGYSRRYSSGSAIRIDASGQMTTIATFSRSIGGSHPTGLTLATDGNFYGVTAGGEWFEGGPTVFTMTPAGQVQIIADLATVGWIGPLTQARDGFLYAVSRTHAYRLTTAGEVTPLHTFVPATEGVPTGSLMEGQDGYLYGASLRGGPQRGGTLFRFDPGSPTR